MSVALDGHFSLIAPDGAEIALNAPPFRLLLGAQGLVFPQVGYSAMRNPQGGDIVVDAWRTGKQVDLPLWVHNGAGAQSYRGNLIRLLRLISRDPRNPSWLVWHGAEERRLAVALRSGATWIDAPDNANVRWAKVVIPLYAPTGAWEAMDWTQVEFSAGEASPFLPQLLPLHLAAGTIIGSGDVYIAGDEAYPKWEVHGSASAVYLSNTFTDPASGEEVTKHCDFPEIDLADGDTLIVDASPAAILAGRAAVIKRANGDEENAWPLMSRNSEVWKLVHGTNTVQAQALGGDANTTAVLWYRPIYAAPWTEAE